MKDEDKFTEQLLEALNLLGEVSTSVKEGEEAESPVEPNVELNVELEEDATPAESLEQITEEEFLDSVVEPVYYQAVLIEDADTEVEEDIEEQAETPLNEEVEIDIEVDEETDLGLDSLFGKIFDKSGVELPKEVIQLTAEELVYGIPDKCHLAPENKPEEEATVEEKVAVDEPVLRLMYTAVPIEEAIVEEIIAEEIAVVVESDEVAKEVDLAEPAPAETTDNKPKKTSAWVYLGVLGVILNILLLAVIYWQQLQIELLLN